jgi:YebC/PmpR family DNA-binding regulatory protein
MNQTAEPPPILHSSFIIHHSECVMAGHSHWAKIKRAKGANDAKRGKMFSKIARKIIVAARNGGGDPSMNIALRYAIEEGRSVNMPNEAVARNIARGTGTAEGVSYEEVTYEAFFGSAGLIIETLTDNRTRTVGEVRVIVEKRGGKMAPANAVTYMFAKKAVIVVARFVDKEVGRKTVREEIKEDAVMEAAMEAGAEDFLPGDETYEVRAAIGDLEPLKKALADKGFKIESAEIASIPSSTVSLDAESARKLLEIVEVLEDNDDVQKVYHNAEIPDEVMAGA